jgi:DNA polymerase IV
VFQSIVGKQWYSRLRGWEVDAVIWGRKSIGHNYAIGRKTADREELATLLMKLCHKVGMRMRRQGFSARGIHLSLGFQNGYWWAKSQKTGALMYSNQDIYHQATRLLKQVVIPDLATHISVTAYMLVPTEPEQLSVFGGTRLDSKALADAADTINNKYGDYTIMAAAMIGLEDIILDRIAFGSVKDYID